MHKSTLKFLGRDSGFGNKNNSAYYEKNNKFILIDCGFSVFKQLKEKFDFNKYEEINIIITHLHNDHAGSLSQFILYIWFTFNKQVKILSKCKEIKKYLDITGVPPESYILKNQMENLTFIETQHSNYLDCYGFEIILDNKNIVYTSDTSTIEPFLTYLEKADELYIDVSKHGGIHLKIDDIVEKLNELKNSGINIFLMHLDDKQYIKKITKNEFNLD